MKIESSIFGGLFVFMFIAGGVYGFVTGFKEFGGGVPLGLVSGLVFMIAAYLWFTGRRVGMRPEDRPEAEIHEGAGEQGFFSPWSWWPLVLGAACATGFLGLAMGPWLIFIAAALAIIGLVGWVFEYSRGDYSH